MSGVGRRTLYRKSVTDEYLNSTPEPRENEEIALVQAPRGSNIIEIKLATGEQALAILPTRFRKLIWVKRGNYLITSTSAGDFETCAGEAGKVRHRVEHILHKEHIKHLKKRGLWPSAFSGETPAAAAQCGSGTSKGVDNTDGRQEDAPAGMESAEAGLTAANAIDASVGACCLGNGGDENVEEALKAGNGNDTEDGEEEEEDDMSDLFVNNNRMAMMQLRMDHDDDDEDSESDSEDESN